MKFSEVVAQTLAWLQRERRVSYRALRLEFNLTEDVLDALKKELIAVKELAVDKDGKILVWVGASPVSRSEFKAPNPQPLTPNPKAEAEAEECFQKAIEIARKQQAKSLELRAVTSLVRLRRQQAMQSAARNTQHAQRSTHDVIRGLQLVHRRA